MLRFLPYVFVTNFNLPLHETDIHVFSSSYRATRRLPPIAAAAAPGPSAASVGRRPVPAARAAAGPVALAAALSHGPAAAAGRGAVPSPVAAAPPAGFSAAAAGQVT